MSEPYIVLSSLMMGLPVLLVQLVLTITIWFATVAVGSWITPFHSLREIRRGNLAVAVTAGGSALAAAIPLAFCLHGAVNSWDILFWALPIMLIQLSAYWFTHLLIPGLGEHLDRDDMAAAVFLLLFRLGFAAINAAAIAA